MIVKKQFVMMFLLLEIGDYVIQDLISAFQNYLTSKNICITQIYFITKFMPFLSKDNCIFGSVYTGYSENVENVKNFKYLQPYEILIKDKYEVRKY